MTKLGGTVISTESAGEYSSAAKGETLEDTIRTVEGYADCIVLRHFQAHSDEAVASAAASGAAAAGAAAAAAEKVYEEGSARRAAGVAKIPILNAGDGPGQHPSQALLDVYTIQREVGRLDNIRIGMVGDLLNGRTVRSLAMVYFVAPPVVAMKEDIKTFLTQRGVAWKEVEDLAEVAAEVDVLYQTRIQKERFTNMQISTEVDDDPRAASSIATWLAPALSAALVPLAVAMAA
ncbi:uncharacterized protein HaLaN_07885 [Haematococcus lacustris]|uniref:Aspartate/ornithine carbamoyltransferase carbamoyl-P binding domain-containing protein n=2 Tax=Haematococcus lacustris TaxID=44745 RepID=A0A699YRL2_HAELA|nr:uncharacterized protein HaLaN_07885 [Haematococcus lacustris]